MENEFRELVRLVSEMMEAIEQMEKMILECIYGEKERREPPPRKLGRSYKNQKSCYKYRRWHASVYGKRYWR